MKSESLTEKLGKHLTKKYRGFISTALTQFFALIYHSCIIFFFYKNNIMQMFYFNIFSISLFCFTTFILFRFKIISIVFFLSLFEVLIHQVLAEYFLGALTGFHFLIMILVVFPFLVEKDNSKIDFPASLFCLIAFIFCEIYFSHKPPVYKLDENIINSIRSVNILASMITVLSVIIIFKIIITYIEKNLEESNKKNEKLLENILPKKVIEALRSNGRADPEKYVDISILFTDIVNFTNLSKNIPPETLINDLNDIFTHFDKIIEKHGCYRIKTIGDAYMAVCGLPTLNSDNAKNIINAALECRNYIENRNRIAERKWTIRLGVHTGNVVAGIVGTTKYIYDVFGDAVNVASRMESSSEEMKICASQDIFEKTKNDFSFENRGELFVKGKGMMNLYFVNNTVTPNPK